MCTCPLRGSRTKGCGPWLNSGCLRKDSVKEFLTKKKGSTSSLSLSSEETTVFQVVLDDDVGDGVKDKLHIFGICGAGEVGVNLLGVLSLVQVLKLTLDVGSCFLVCVGAWKRQEAGKDGARKSPHRKRY